MTWPAVWIILAGFHCVIHLIEQSPGMSYVIYTWDPSVFSLPCSSWASFTKSTCESRVSAECKVEVVLPLRAVTSHWEAKRFVAGSHIKRGGGPFEVNDPNVSRRWRTTRQHPTVPSYLATTEMVGMTPSSFPLTLQVNRLPETYQRFSSEIKITIELCTDWIPYDMIRTTKLSLLV